MNSHLLSLLHLFSDVRLDALQDRICVLCGLRELPGT